MELESLQMEHESLRADYETFKSQAETESRKRKHVTFAPDADNQDLRDLFTPEPVDTSMASSSEPSRDRHFSEADVDAEMQTGIERQCNIGPDNAIEQIVSSIIREAEIRYGPVPPGIVGILQSQIFEWNIKKPI